MYSSQLKLSISALCATGALCCANVSVAQQPQRFTPSGTLKYMPLLDGWTSIRESPFGEVFQRDPKTPPQFAIAYVNEFDPSVDKNTDDLVADVRANIAKYVQFPFTAVVSSEVVANRERSYPCAQATHRVKADGRVIRATASTVEVQLRIRVCRDMRTKPRGFIVSVSSTDEIISPEFERQTRDFLSSVRFRKE